MVHFLPPHKIFRYHVYEYGERNKQISNNAVKLFNYRRSSIRMVIARCFEVLKTHFLILNAILCFKPIKLPLIISFAYFHIYNHLDVLLMHGKKLNEGQAMITTHC